MASPRDGGELGDDPAALEVVGWLVRNRRDTLGAYPQVEAR
jgi:hypothetical protein